MKKKLQLSLLITVVAGNFLLLPAVSRAENVKEVMQEVAELRKSNPQEAINRIQRYITENPTEKPEQLASMEETISSIYASTLKQPDKAIAALDSALARPLNPRDYVRLSRAKFYKHITFRQYKEANAYFHEVLPKYLEQPPITITPPLEWMLENYFVNIVRFAGTADERIQTFRLVLEKQPHFLKYSRMTVKVIQDLMAQPGKEKEALAWAKLYWMTCNFEGKTVNQATTLLQRAWVATEMNPTKGIAFLKAMEDLQAPNPLTDVPPPSLDMEKLKLVLKDKSATTAHQKIFTHLLLGEPGNAMLIARRIMLRDPIKGANTATLEMARILKATDLNLVRANALLQYMQTGEGTNPVDEFFKQHPVKSSQ